MTIHRNAWQHKCACFGLVDLREFKQRAGAASVQKILENRKAISERHTPVTRIR
jgi:hypothetical protein